jgi:hypothetical protein
VRHREVGLIVLSTQLERNDMVNIDTVLMELQVDCLLTDEALTVLNIVQCFKKAGSLVRAEACNKK